MNWTGNEAYSCLRKGGRDTKAIREWEKKPSMHIVKLEIMSTEVIYPFANFDNIKIIFISLQILSQHV